MKPASAKCSQPEMPTVEFAKKQLTEVKIRKEFKAVWGSDNYFTGRSMDVYITKIRKYLNRDSNIEIQNIHGEGYKLVVTQN